MMDRHIAVQMEAYGFIWTPTGGGCSAYRRPTIGGGEELVTCADDPTAPDSLDEPVVYGLYDADGEILVTWPRASLRDLITDLQFAGSITKPAVVP